MHPDSAALGSSSSSSTYSNLNLEMQSSNPNLSLPLHPSVSIRESDVVVAGKDTIPIHPSHSEEVKQQDIEVDANVNVNANSNSGVNARKDKVGVGIDVPFNETEYLAELKVSTKALSNLNTSAYFGNAIGFRSGYRNMAMTFMGFLLLNDQAGHPQVLLQSLKWRDQDSNVFVPHEELFDVVHWNSFYPDVPRLVSYNESLHTDVRVRFYSDTTRVDWQVARPLENATMPYALGKRRHHVFGAYRNWSNRVSRSIEKMKTFERKVFEGAWRPHPKIQLIIDNFLTTQNVEDLMVLHARIEPDMQRHNVCPDKKVTNFTDILSSMYSKFPTPPADTVLLMLNRNWLEKEGTDPNSENQLAVHNLRVLNDAFKNGLWDGRVKVIEAGTALAENTEYHKNRLLVGGIINYYLALGAKIFVGTEISSYSSDVVRERFYKGAKQNYFYYPDEMRWMTPPDVQGPPEFSC